MRALIQRVREGGVAVEGKEHGRIGKGFVILLGIRTGDSEGNAESLADKCSTLRIFEDSAGKMNLALKDVDGSALVVSQFTLYADARHGNRPGFTEAARPEEAEPLYEAFVERLRMQMGKEKVLAGVFGAHMEVRIVNDGPVTIMLEN